jgi:hypothetical protein
VQLPSAWSRNTDREQMSVYRKLVVKLGNFVKNGEIVGGGGVHE